MNLLIRHLIGHPIHHSLWEIPYLCHENGLLPFFMMVNSTISMILSDILYEKAATLAKIGLLETMTVCIGGILVKLSKMELKMLVKGGETNTVELKLAAPRAVDLAERLCGMANARGGIVIIGVEDSTH
jgi:hypothetical protein